MLMCGRKTTGERLKMEEREVTTRRSAEGLGGMQSSAQMMDCLGWEQGHLPVEGEEERRLLVGWGLGKRSGSHDVREQVNWEWGK